jgi:general L-amino acid transport system permease protein
MQGDNISYVRTKMLPEATPPVSQQGIVKWVRENLFSSWLNAILTVASIAAVYYVLSGFLPWAISPTWSGTSLANCRDILSEAGRVDDHGTHGACWGVIRDRWEQLMFGFYPNDSYWRPTTALVLFLISILPVLFTSLPRKLLIGTAVAPLILFWLIWGGSLWTPITVGVGFVLGAAAFKIGSDRSGLIVAVLASLLVTILFWLFLSGPIATVLGKVIPIYLEPVRSKDIGGFMLAVIIGLAGIVLSLPLGILLALGRSSDMWIVNKLSTGFIEVIRGVPLIVWLFTASLLLNYFLPPGTTFDLMLRVIIMVTLFSAAYIAEVVRGGLAALAKGQYEAADSLGLDYWKSMRLVVLPQALKISIPGIVNTFIGLFKDTTLVMFIGLFDPLGLISAIRATTDWNGVYWELYVFIAIVFFIFCYSMGRYSLYLERKLRREHR